MIFQFAVDDLFLIILIVLELTDAIIGIVLVDFIIRIDNYVMRFVKNQEAIISII